MTAKIYRHFKIKKISTHTLTWSVTQPLFAVCKLCAISTHTLTWSVTRGALVF